MTDREVELLLKSEDLSFIETSIAKGCGTYVNKDHLDFTIGILRREIANSALGINSIKDLLRSKKDSIIKFGIDFYKTQAGEPHIEEYREGEEVNEDEKSNVLESHGLGIGFGIKYAIYFNFLENDMQDELLNFLKAQRIPYAKDFAKTLNKVHNLYRTH